MKERCGNDQIASFDNMNFTWKEVEWKVRRTFLSHVAKRGCLFTKPSLFLLLNNYIEMEKQHSLATYGGEYVAD